jgi:ribosomal protein S18 acetylase RimI-like enzyme
MSLALRQARLEDATRLGAAHVQAWRETYTGIVPQALLAGMDAGRRAALWRETLDQGGHAVLAEEAGALLGFASCGPQRDAALGFGGEIFAIYLLRQAQRRGIGRALMAAMAHHLLAEGLVGVSLWVVTANMPARSFYERLGGRVVAERVLSRDGWQLEEIAYGWDRTELLMVAEPAPLHQVSDAR